MSGHVNLKKDLPIKGEVPSAANILDGCRFHLRYIYAKARDFSFFIISSNFPFII